MKNVAALLAVAGVAAASNAQLTANMDLKLWNGSAWVDSLNVAYGSTVECVMLIGWSGGSAFGVGGAVYNIQGSGLAGDTVIINGSADAATGLAAGLLGRDRVAPFNFGAATQAVFTSGSNFRIDASADAGNSNGAGIASSQRDPVNAGAAFVTANPAAVYRFAITVGNSDHSITLSAPTSEVKRGEIGFFSSSTATRSTTTQVITTDGAVINVIPAPGAVALLGLAGLVAGRRRR